MKTRISIARGDNVVYSLDSELSDPKELFAIAYEDFRIKNHGIAEMAGMVVSFEKI